MPLAADPTAIYRIVLESDKDKTPQPALRYRYLTLRQWKQVAEVHQKMETLGGLDEITAGLLDAVRTGLVGWDNITGPDGEIVPFDLDRIEDIFMMTEIQEILVKLLKQHPTLSDKKKFESPSPASTDKSAAPAAAVSDAPTSPAN